MRWEVLTDGVIEMTSDTIGGSPGVLGRFRLPKLAKPRSPTVVFCKRRRNRISFVIALLSLLCCFAAQGYAAENLECPEIGPARVPDLIGDATGGGLFATENRIDLANEINDATGSSGSRHCLRAGVRMDFDRFCEDHFRGGARHGGLLS